MNAKREDEFLCTKNPSPAFKSQTSCSFRADLYDIVYQTEPFSANGAALAKDTRIVLPGGVLPENEIAKLSETLNSANNPNIASMMTNQKLRRI